VAARPYLPVPRSAVKAARIEVEKALNSVTERAYALAKKYKIKTVKTQNKRAYQ